MDRLFPFPVYTFLKMVVSSGGVTVRKVGAFILWLIKMVLFEPLRWIELAVFNHKVKQHKIKNDPVFILGFYRSGTSYLHHFLTQDDRFGYHTTFQMIFPDMMLANEKWMSPFLDSLFKLIRFQDPCT